MDVNKILSQLDELSKCLNCGICAKKCVKPVRVKVCGHYFCLKCFKDIAHFCPKCKLYHEERDVDYNDDALQTVHILSDLKRHLLSTSILIDSTDSKIEDQQKTDSFFYNNNTYHMNYIDELCNKVNAKGETPLHIACKKNNLESVKQIIDIKTDLNSKDFAGWAPLHEAVENGNVETVEILLKHGALIDIPGPEYVTPLHKAVSLGNERLIRLLLKYGANQNLITYFGRKPVDCTQNEQIKCILSDKIICHNRTLELFSRKKISVFFYYTEDDYKVKLLDTKQVKIEKEFDPKKITHFIIRRTHKLSAKLLCAILEGCHIVPQEWIDEFLSNRYFIPIPHYTFISNKLLNVGIQRALINSLLKQPKLFDGIHFFIFGHNTAVEICNIKFTKESIASIICAGGGKVLHRAPTPGTCEEIVNFPYHSNKTSGMMRCCHYIIYEQSNPPTLQYQMAELKHKSSQWLVECVINFTITD